MTEHTVTRLRDIFGRRDWFCSCGASCAGTTLAVELEMYRHMDDVGKDSHDIAVLDLV